MSIKVKLVDGNDNVQAGIYTPTSSSHKPMPGLVTYTHPLESGTPVIVPFTNDTYGIEQDIDGSAAGTLTTMHNGTDTVAFTASATVGTWDFASTAQANTGTKSIDATGTRNGDIATFTNSTLNVGDYDKFRGFIYITSWPSSGSKNFSFQLSNGGTPLGTSVNLSVYVDTSVLNTWQLFEIPMVDFQISVPQFDAVILRVIDAGQGNAPSAYFDDMSFVTAATGGGETYLIKPPLDQDWVIRELKWIGVGPATSNWDEFFGISQLTNGYQLAFTTKGSTTSSYTARNLFDMLQYPNVVSNVTSGTSTNIFEISLLFSEKDVVLQGNLEEAIEIRVRDNLSSITKLRATAIGHVLSLA